MNAGDCYWRYTGIDRDGKEKGHLFVVLLDPIDPEQLTVSVPCSTIRDSPYDGTCELEAGCHPFIGDRSYINYAFADIVSIVDIQRLVSEGKAKIHKPIGSDLLETIQRGLRDSPRTRRRVKRWFNEQTMDDLFGQI